LVSFGRRRRNIIFTSFHFSPHKILLKFFSIDFKVLFYHVFKPLLCIFPSFSLTYKLQSCISKYQIFHTLIAKLILIEYFFCSLTSWLANDYVLWASSHTNERKIAPRIIPKLNTNLAKSWWRSWIARGAPSFRSRTPSSLVLLNFSELLYLVDFVIGWPHF
jgi:hypothetical protein